MDDRCRLSAEAHIGQTPRDKLRKMADDALPQLTADEIGEIGETALRAWCVRYGITPLRTTKDKFGWDFILEWEDATRDRLSPRARSCKVQVKTTAIGKRSEDIALSNWESMALEHDPWFVLCVGLTDRDISEAFLVHIDKTWVTKAVVRLTADDERDKRHKRTLDVQWGEPDRLHEPLAGAFKDNLFACAGPSAESYREAKRKWIADARAEVTLKGRFTVVAASETEQYELLAKFALGLVDTIPTKNWHAVLQHHGKSIRNARPLDIAYGKITRAKTAKVPSVRLVFYDDARSDQVEISFKAYVVQNMFPWLPKFYWRSRFVSPMLEFTWNPREDGSAEMIIGFDVPVGSGRKKLSDLARIGRLGGMFYRAPTAGLHATFRHGGKEMIIPLSQVPPSAIDPEFLALASVIEGAGNIARFFGLDENRTLVDPSDLMSRKLSVLLVDAGIRGTLGTLDLRVGIMPNPTESLSGKKTALVLKGIVPLGEYVLIGVFTLVGPADWKAMDDGVGTVGVVGGEAALRFKQIIPNARWEEEKKALKDRVASLIEELSRTGIEAVVA